MKLGKFGIPIWSYAVAALIFGLLDLYLGVIAVAALAILAEKDDYANRQVFQAVMLYLFYSLIILLIDWSIGGLRRLFLLLEKYGIASDIGTVVQIISDMVFVAYLVLAIIGIFRLFKGKEAVPFLAKTSKIVLNQNDDAIKEDKGEPKNKSDEDKDS